MTKLQDVDFIKPLLTGSINVAQAKRQPALAGLDLDAADLDHNGVITGPAEAAKLFRLLDNFDHNGDAKSVEVSGQVAQMWEAIKSLTTPTRAGSLRDAALSKGFPAGLVAPMAQGATGLGVVAVQYTLGRLGYFNTPTTQSFGPETAAAVSAFQQSTGLPATGAVDSTTLTALDLAVTTRDLRVPAARVADPMQYLSDFTARGISAVHINTGAQRVGWSHPDVQAAYSAFVTQYWPVLKENHLECDCKTLALFFMDQFRTKVKQDTGVQLPLPSTSRGSIPAARWSAMTAQRPGELFSRFETLPRVRAGYSSAVDIQNVDPNHSMLYGVNVRYPGVNADQVSRSAVEKGPWKASQDNHGDFTLPEVPVPLLQVGDIIFLDHTGDGPYDHTINVVGVEKDAQGRTVALTLAVGSFDDMKDADGATAPAGLREVNNYVEEVRVTLNANGHITGSEVTWASEPSYVSPSRYSAMNTLMERRPNGTLKVCRWG